MHILSAPIQGLLAAMVQLVGNQGWAIVFFTAGIRVLILPVQIWQQRVSARMATVQAKARQIQSMYKGKEAQERLSQLYSPGAVLLGCLPTLLQWPVLVAVYVAINTYPFIVPAGFLWLQNLTIPDPYFVLPALATAISLWQTWISVPPQQRLTMTAVSTLMLFVLVRTSAAAALYWVTSSLIGVVQQYALVRKASVT